MRGSGFRDTRSGPNTRASVSLTKAASAASLTVGGYSGDQSTCAVSPWAAAIPSASSVTSRGNRADVSGDRVRTSPEIQALSGITLFTSPAESRVMVATTGSNTPNRRVTMVCSAVPNSHTAVTGSSAVWGCEPCPPRPWKVTVRLLAPAIAVPGR